jgi:hypothetical protein
VVPAQLARELERELAERHKALRELGIRAENFWAFLQGEYGVKLSAEDQEDHNVHGFFSAVEAALAAGVATLPDNAQITR